MPSTRCWPLLVLHHPYQRPLSRQSVQAATCTPSRRRRNFGHMSAPSSDSWTSGRFFEPYRVGPQCSRNVAYFHQECHNLGWQRPRAAYRDGHYSRQVGIALLSLPKACPHSSVVRHLLAANRGLIKRIGVNLDTREYERVSIVHARGAWVTPGIFDMHSHLGVDSVGRSLLFVRRTKSNFL